MTLNDRIALELGRAVLARLIAEARADQLAERLEDARETKTEPEGEPA